MESWNNNYHDLIDSIPKGIQVINRQGYLVDANRAWLLYFGASLADIKGRHLRDIMQDMMFANPAAIDKSLPHTEYTAPAALEVLKTGLPYSVPFNKDRMIAMARPIYNPRGLIDYVVTTISENAQFSAFDLSSFPDGGGESASQPLPTLIGESPALLELRRTIAMVAPAPASVLICGETGTGKEIVASELHHRSGRNSGAFVRVNCAAIPENLIESELFGYERGAFTGALTSGKAGLIEAADGGTLFLDEINALPLAQQGKLLRVLESRSVQRIGGIKEKPVNFRLISATNTDLQTLVAEKAFRSDLFYRLNVVQIQIPPLRERREDIRPIMDYYLLRFAKQYDKKITLVSDAWRRLLAYDWPGNVRELRNLAEYLVITATQSEVLPEHLDHRYRQMTSSNTLPPLESFEPPAVPDEALSPDGDFSLKEYLEECERKVLEEAFRRYGSSRRVAEALKIDQSSVVRKKAKLHI